LNFTEQQMHERTPRLGNEVRFADGTVAGRVRALNDRDFIVIKGRKKIRQFVLPYSSIQSLENRTVILRLSKSKFSGAKSATLRYEKDGISKKDFIRELDERLALDDPERADRMARIVLCLLSKRLSAQQKKKLRATLPLGIRSIWATVEQRGSDEYSDVSDFLIPVRKQGRLESMEEAFIVTREVFSSLRRIMPLEQSFEISRSLPMGLREIWESAAETNELV
jgi:uncharacterized protein (DUF2267 family)